MNPESSTRGEFVIGATFAGWEDSALSKNRGQSLGGEIGVTTGSFFRHIAFQAEQPGKIRMLDIPKVMRDELGLQVIDLMNRTMDSFEPSYLEKLRKAGDDHGSIFSNLKLNQKGIDIASTDQAVRRAGLKAYTKSIDAAQILGCRWVRPVAGAGKNPDRAQLAESLRELIDYGGSRGIGILMENVGWVGNDPDAIPDMIKRVGKGLAASPDTGNWTDQVKRIAGLKKAYPFAATSDFKAFQLEPDGTHPKYDLEECFRIGWEAGFRGPWCIEHFHEDLAGLIAGFGTVRDLLRRWIARAGKA